MEKYIDKNQDTMLGKKDILFLKSDRTEEEIESLKSLVC